MKTSFNSKENILLRLKNFWFATQLLIVSVSLPVLCFVELAHPGNDATSKQQEEVIKNSANQNEVVGLKNTVNTIKLS